MNHKSCLLSLLTWLFVSQCLLSEIGGGPSVGVQAWEWSDFVSSSDETSNNVVETTLSIEQVSAMRVRDIKWRLARQHGYSAEELGRMIDKKELVESLAFEEEKVRRRAMEDLQRTVLQRGILWALVAVAVAILWPVLQQAKEVASVRLVIYTDRKTHEARRCWELKSFAAGVGVTAMFVLDLLQVWLTASVLLSWVMTRNAYFFPIPHIPIRPAQFVGGATEKAFGSYGINVGSMAVTWGLRFLHGRIESWTGQAMYNAQKKLKRNNSSNNSNGKPRSKKKQPKPETAPSPPPVVPPPSSLPEQWMEPTTTTSVHEPPDPPVSMEGIPGTTAQSPSVPLSNAHFDFLGNLDIDPNHDENVATQMDELD